MLLAAMAENRWDYSRPRWVHPQPVERCADRLLIGSRHEHVEPKGRVSTHGAGGRPSYINEGVRDKNGDQGVKVTWLPLVRLNPLPQNPPLGSRYQAWNIRVSPEDQPPDAPRPVPQVATPAALGT